MNMLNQIIIEGTLTEDGQVKGEEFPYLELSCMTTRSYRDRNGKLCEEDVPFVVRAYGADYCRRVERMTTKGRGVRIVGKLTREYILSEHIDFKPKDTEKSEEKAS